jgi:hypothetical protein
MKNEGKEAEVCENVSVRLIVVPRRKDIRKKEM